MKSYTDLEQSKVLAKFLPIESADMAYYFWENSGNIVTPRPFILDGTEVKEGGMFTYLNCWSLAALLAVLPDELEDNHFLTLDKEGKEYCCCYEDGNGNSFKHNFADNPVDACVAMIEHLHELNLL